MRRAEIRRKAFAWAGETFGAREKLLVRGQRGRTGAVTGIRVRALVEQEDAKRLLAACAREQQRRHSLRPGLVHVRTRGEKNFRRFQIADASAIALWIDPMGVRDGLVWDQHVPEFATESILTLHHIAV